MGTSKKDQLLGRLDLLVLRILSSGDSMHGYAIAERIEQLSENVLQVGEGSSVSFLARRSPYTATVEILNRRGPVSVEVRN